MSRANRIALAVIGLLLVIAIGWYVTWFASNHERRYKDVRVDISPQAKHNRFLAAEHYLRESGLEVESLSGRDILTKLPPVGDTLVMARLGNRLPRQRFDSLIEWLKQGGHLIVTPSAYWDEEEPGNLLMEELGVRLMQSDINEVTECNQQSNGDGAGGDSRSQCADDTSPDENALGGVDDTGYSIAKINVPTLSSEVTAAFRLHRYLEDGDGWAQWRVDAPMGFHILRYRIESGTVTVFSDLDLFENERIDERDHAYLLSLLAWDSAKVWLLYSLDMPALPVQLWQRAPFLVVVVIVLLLLAGWRMFLYTGPKLEMQQRIRRNLLEHIDATAEFGWRVDGGRKLFEDNRGAIEQAWRRRHPGLNGMDLAARCEWIGEKSGLTASSVQRTLYGEVVAEQDFIKATMVLQRLVSGLSYKRERV